MSPGATFERVYGEIKRMLVAGELPPGSPIEPAVIGKEIAASITPVRDALHRLTAERLVEAPNHNGFRVAVPSEAALRDLYHWNGLVLGLAAKRVAPDPATGGVEDRGAMSDIVASTAALFLSVAHAAGSAELAITVRSLNDRLATARRAEVATLPAMSEELSGLAAIIASGDRTALASALTRYHRRRIGAVAAIVAHLVQNPFGCGAFIDRLR
ncbi:GntR family transcriptional regulator [Sphingomonas glacialis]|uniref:GntR family transcriptional regulator n=1 Tax=Sphingomonas glacialis TaxID=658225 RepID=A0A502G6S3_9SPHN|nr:GntR family transcriptional regulator [Sphingomonas glacialis]TPG56563.1 GntR family transcriptional regulator [Sphingomonas glacialis]